MLPESNEFFTRRRVNIDNSNKCPLQCPRCSRQYYNENKIKIPGGDLTIPNFEKLLNFFEHFIFEGQVSDPIHNPNFINFLELCYQKSRAVEIHTASSVKPMSWYIKAFEANPNAQWIFSIDGLPNESHFYRVNQDGVKLFNVMLESKKYLNLKPKWQYIVFKYNENHVDEAISLAAEVDVNFYILQSSRWISDDDPLMPSEKYKMSLKWK